jgi:hypothetical protein
VSGRPGELLRQETKVAVLTKELQTARDRTHELGRQAKTAFLLSSLAAILIGVGVNFLAGDGNQTVGVVITGLGLVTQIATYVVVQRP